MPITYTLPDGRQASGDEVLQMMNSTDLRFAGMGEGNYMHYAAEAVQQAQDQRRAGGEPSLKASEQVAIQDAYRQMAGVQPVSAGRDYYREIRGARQRQDFEGNLGMSYMAGMGEWAARGIGLVAPEYSARLSQDIERTYMPQADTWSGKLGNIGATATQMLPALAAGGGQVLPTLIGTFGAPGAGGVRAEVAQRRQQGQEIGAGAEWAAALGTGVVEVLSGYVSRAIAIQGGRVLQQYAPTLMKAMQTGGRGAMRQALTGIIRLEIGALGEAAEESLTELVENTIARAAYAPERPLTAGMGEAAEQAFLLQHLMAPLGLAAERPGGRGVDVSRPDIGIPPQQPAAGPEMKPQDLLSTFLASKTIPDDAKQQVVDMANAAADAGQPPNMEGIIREVMGQRAAVEDAIGRTVAAEAAAPPIPEATPEQFITDLEQQIAAAKQAAVPMPAPAPETAVSPVAEPSLLRKEGELGAPPAVPAVPAAAAETETAVDRANREFGLVKPVPGLAEVGQTVRYKLNQTDKLREGIVNSVDETRYLVTDTADGNSYMIDPDQGLIARGVAAAPEAPGRPIPGIPTVAPTEAPKVAPEPVTAAEEVPAAPAAPPAAPPAAAPVAKAPPEAPKKPAKPEKPEPRRYTEAEEQALRREQATEREAAEPPAEAGPAASAEAEDLFNLSITRPLNVAEKERLGTPQENLARLAEDAGDRDALVRFTTSQMGLFKTIGRRLKGEGADVDVDDMVDAGVVELQRALIEPIKKGPNKGRTRADVMVENPSLKVSSYLFGRNSLAYTAMKRAAFPLRGRLAEKEAVTTKPERSLEAVQEKAGRADVEALRVQQPAAFEAGREQSLVAEYTETIEKMRGDGATEAEMLEFLQNQDDVHWSPGIPEALAADDVDALREHVYPASDSLTTPAGRKAIAGLEKQFSTAGKPMTLDVVKPYTVEEKAVRQMAAERGLELIFVRDLPGTALVTYDRTQPWKKPVIAITAGLGGTALYRVATHELWHAITGGMGTLHLPKKGMNFMVRAAKHYLDGATRKVDRAETAEAKEFWTHYRDRLILDPDKLMHEAGADVVGAVLSDPATRAKLSMQQPALFQQIWDAIKVYLKRLAGKDTTIDDVLRQFNAMSRSSKEGQSTLLTSGIFNPRWSKRPKRKQPGVAALPALWSPGPAFPDITPEGDVAKFTEDLTRMVDQAPKVSGKPELANPMHREGARRLMDYLDEMDKVAGNPKKKGDIQRNRNADKLLASSRRRLELTRKVEGRATLTDEETIAAQQVIRETGEAVLAGPTISNIMRLQRQGFGYRRGGTDQARAMRARHDRIKTPSERLREFAIAAIADVPAEIGQKIEKLEQAGNMEAADRLLKQHGEKAAAMLAQWKKDGIDLTALDDISALAPAVQARIMRDIERLNYSGGVWDVIHEIRRNNLMYAPATMMRNTIGGAYAVADTFIVKPVARALQTLVGIDRTGETAAAWHAFASHTSVTRAVQNFTNTLIHEVPWLEAEMKLKGVETPKGVHQVEIHTPAAIRGEASRRAVEYATKALVGDPMAAVKAGGVAKQLVGLFGHVQRVPQRMNAAVDEFVKTLHVHSEVAAHAVRLGRHNGLEIGSTQMQQFVEQQIENMASEAWQAAIESGETWRVTFQGEAGAFEQFILNMTKQEGVGNFFRLLVPFRKTPIQLAAQAMMHVPGVGGLRMAQRTVQHVTGKKRYTSDEVARHAAQQLIGIAGIALLWGLVDSDDEDLNITGPAAYHRRYRKERVTRQLTTPYMTFKFGGTSYNYNYVEPFSQWFGTLVAFIEESKAAQRRGKAEPGEIAKRLWSRLTGMYSDQTYIRTLGDVYKAMYDPDVYGRRVTVNFAGSWLPNVVDTAMRASDPYIRERRRMGLPGERASWGKLVQREMLPTGNILPPPKVDLFGNQITAGKYAQHTTMFVTRLISPVQRRTTVEGKQAAVIDMLLRFNSTKLLDDPHDPAVWFQEPSNKVTVQYRGDRGRIQEEMNAETYNLFLRLSGLMLAQQVESREWNMENPTRRDIAVLETLITKTRTAARKFFTAAHQARAMGDANAYKRILDKVREKVAEYEQAK